MVDIKERIYAGILGKCIGVRLGAPIESASWNKELINRCFGNINSYIKDSNNFAADDDTNCPIFFARTLIDYPGQLTSDKIAWTWLNYTRPEQGMFWWGGVGVSSEHTAYNNLKNSIFPPSSGSSKINGDIIANQIGAQIFIDHCGLININNPEKAMSDAKLYASVSHDDNALIGSQFIAGCISMAINYDNTIELIADVLDLLDSNSDYVKIMRIVYEYCLNNLDDYNLAYQFICTNYGYDKFGGECHIIPNACIVLVGLLYGLNNFNRAIEITCMCGWDTDSNAGVVGCIMGVMLGLNGIDIKYRKPINDIVVCSSMSPYLNIVDLLDYTDLLWSIRNNVIYQKNFKYNFDYCGVSRGLRIENDFRIIQDNLTFKTRGCYNVLIDNLVKDDTAAIYLKTYYMYKDFPDNRYDPVIMPLAYSGDVYQFIVESQFLYNDGLKVAGYVELTNGKIILCNDWVNISNHKREVIRFQIPNTNGINIYKVGIRLKTDCNLLYGSGLLARFIIHEFEKCESANSLISFDNPEIGFFNNISPFSNFNINSTLIDKKLKLECNSKIGFSLTGRYYQKYLKLKTVVTNIVGEEFIVAFRIKGLENYYYYQFLGNKIKLIHHYHFEDEVLKIWDFCRKDEISIDLEIKNSLVCLNIGGMDYSYSQINNDYGHYGFGGKNASFYISNIIFRDL